MKQLTFFILVLNILLVKALAAPSAYDLLKQPTHTHVTLSPEGDTLAFAYLETKDYCLDKYGKAKKDVTTCSEKKKQYRASYKIAFYDLDSASVTNLIPLPDDFFVSNITWASSERILTTIHRRTTSNKTGSRTNFGGSRIVSMPKVDGKIITLLDGTDRDRANFNISTVTNLMLDDPDNVIIPAIKKNDLDLWKVNITNGDYERVAAGKKGTYHWYTDNSGKPLLRFDTTLFGSSVTMHAWSDAKQSWEQAQTFKRRRRGQNDVGIEFSPILPADKPNQIYVLSDDEDGTTRSIKIYDTEQNKYVETVFEHEKYDVASALTNSRTGRFSGVQYYADRLVVEFEDKALQKHFNALNKYFGNSSNIGFLGSSGNGEYAIIYRTSPSHPGEYYRYKLDNAVIEPIFSRRPELAGVKFGEAEIITVNTRDNETITAYVTHPSHGKDASAPLIVMPHGGPESRDYFDYDPDVQFLATRGYRILQVNFRGSDGYGRAFAKAGYGEWGGVMQNDITDAVKQLHAQGIAGPDSTCIVGYSYGGYAALMGAATTPELYKCVVSGGGVTDLLASMRETRNGFGPNSEPYEYWSKSIGNPRDVSKKLRETSPVNLAEKIRVPVLLMHGEEDRIVYVRHSRDMENALKKAEADVEYIEFEFEGHRNWTLRNDILYQEKIEEFLEEHLK